MSEEDKTTEDIFKKVFERNPGAFPEGTSIEDKVDIIGKKTKELEARKEKLAEEARANLERLDEGLKRDGISIEQKAKPKEPEQKRTAETSIQTDDKGLQEDAIKPQEPEQKRTAETFIQTDGIKKNTSSEQAVSPAANQAPEAKKIYPTLDKGEQFNQDKAESRQLSKQRSPETEKKQPDAPSQEHHKQPQQQENIQESQRKGGIWNRLVHLAKKILEKLMGEEGRVEHISSQQKIPQKNTAGENEAQEKGMDKTSFIEINGKNFDLEPGKNFSYVTNNKTLSVSITYINQPQLEMMRQNNLSQPEVAQQNNLLPSSMNLNINSKGYSIPPGENFSYKSNNVEISVTHGNQRERNYDEILKEAQTLGGNLREHGAQMKERGNNDFGHTTNTPDVQEKSTGGHSR